MGVVGLGTPKENDPIIYHKYYQVSFIITTLRHHYCSKRVIVGAG